MLWIGLAGVRDGEREQVDIDGLDGAGDESCSLDLEEIVPAIGPDNEIRAIDCRTSSKASEDQNGGVESIKLVVEAASCFQNRAFNLLSWKDEL